MGDGGHLYVQVVLSGDTWLWDTVTRGTIKCIDVACLKVRASTVSAS